MGRLEKLMAISRAVNRIRKLERQAPGTAVPELRKLLADPEKSRELIVPLLMALRTFGPAAAVVLPLVEKYTRPEQTERVRRLAGSVIEAMRGGGTAGPD